MQNKDRSNIGELIKPSLSNRLGIITFTFIVMIIITGLISAFLPNLGLEARSAFLLSSIVQSTLAFIFPSWLAAFLCSRNPRAYLGISAYFDYKEYLWAIFLLVIIGPAMNLIIEWNQNLSFPESMQGIYSVLKNAELKAEQTTQIILSDYSWWGLISGILVIGCLTGFAEEMMFRAGVQKAFTSSGMNVHLAIWTSAFIFSFLHFQFFGFVPRLILGACFGYVYYYSGSLWVSASMHAFNNSCVVIMAWLAGRKLISFDLDSLGTISAGQVWMAVACAWIAFLYIRLLAPFVFTKRPLHPPVSR